MPDPADSRTGNGSHAQSAGSGQRVRNDRAAERNAVFPAPRSANAAK